MWILKVKQSNDDKSVRALQIYIHNKTVGRLIKLTKGKISWHEQDIDK